MMALTMVVERQGVHVVAAAIGYLGGNVGVAVRLFVGRPGDGCFVGIWAAAAGGRGGESGEVGR